MSCKDQMDILPPLERNDENGLDVEDSDSDFNDIAGDGFDEDEESDEEKTNCLFCSQAFDSVEVAMEHLVKTHGVNFPGLKAKFNLDQYGFIKLINCIRIDGVSAERVAKAEKVFWDDEKYLKPKMYEPWLCYDYEELKAIAVSNDKTSNEESKLQALVHSLQQKVKDQAVLLEQANDDMIKMRSSFQRLLENAKDSGEAKKKPLHSVGASSLHADESYFSSYAHFSIHHEMLSDAVRTSSYRNALLENRDFVKGKDVLDVGCGTSVLSIFASQAGAKTVVGIDNSDIIYNAMDIVKKNNIANVKLVKGRLEDTELPQQKFDIIISEWMGYFLLFEGMLDSVIYARDNHLKEGGMLLPNRCTMSLLGYGSDELYKSHITFWNDVYGLDMSTMRKEVIREPLIDIVDPQHTLTATNVLVDLDLQTVELNYSDFVYNFSMECTKDGTLSSFVGYFDTYFDLPNPVMFSTSPQDKPTHWKQVVFFLEQPQAIKVGDIIQGKFICRRSRNSVRSLDITIEVFGRRCTYFLD